MENLIEEVREVLTSTPARWLSLTGTHSTAALERTPNLRVLMFHGPLVYLMGPHAGHNPFTERDIDRFLHHYAPSETLGRQLKEDFLHFAILADNDCLRNGLNLVLLCDFALFVQQDWQRKTAGVKERSHLF